MSVCYGSYFVELDSGESLADLFRAEKSLFVNNFPQVIMAHAVSALAANFDLVVDKFDGCGIPVLIGHPVSGKSTALKAVLSVFGDTTLVNSKCDIDFVIVKEEGNGYEAGQTSKGQTKMPRFRLEGPRPCKIFCFALIHYVCKQLLCFCARSIPKK